MDTIRATKQQAQQSLSQQNSVYYDHSAQQQWYDNQRVLDAVNTSGNVAGVAYTTTSGLAPAASYSARSFM